MPSEIRRLHQDYEARGLRVVAINIQESPDKATAWSQRERVTFPIVFDLDGRTSSAYGVRATPTVFVIGRDGKFIGAASGNRAWTSPEGRAVIEAALKS